MRSLQGYKTLIIMLAAAAVCIVVGFLVLRRNYDEPQPAASAPADDSAAAATPTPTPTPAPSIPADWLTYTNTKYGYQLQYPPNLKAGSISGNSTLGTYDAPVRGFDVGPLVLVSLTGSLRQTGADYFNESYNLALNPPAKVDGGPDAPGSCSVDQLNNPNVDIKSVSCTGEGGAARYALIRGQDYDVFVDDYSKGFDDTDNGDLADPDDYIQILNSFKFTSADESQATPTPTPSATPTDTPLSVQSFAVTADDGGATPDTITVPAGTIVNLTFHVGGSVTDGGLDFRSSAANTGPISAGTSKTIAFTVDDSFEFTPYGATSGVALGYQIKVVAQ